ncbi:MAG: hypothetical protein L6282_01885 [Candidatus Methanoperedenaceae archaeon]|nr:hypothetical protein [Candidatus Methanoperedenaceae archaeon]
MSNERYKLMVLAHYMAEHGFHNALMLFVSPGDGGKTDTIDMFMRDFEGVYVIPSSTETKQFALLKERKNTVAFILDEPDDWEQTNLKKVLMTLKHVATGKLKPARATSFIHSPSSRVCSASIIYCNNTQFNSITHTLNQTGIMSRALIIMSEQDDNVKDYVSSIYKSQDCKSGYKLPIFKKNLKIIEGDDVLADQQKWINRYFSGFCKNTVEWICKLVTTEQFNEFKPFLKSHYDYENTNETIEFEEKTQGE